VVPGATATGARCGMICSMRRLAPAILLALSAQLPLGASDASLSCWATVDGMSIHYLDSGPSRTEAVLLFVHGYSGSAANFKPLFEPLSSVARCIAVDLPGCGRSEKPDTHYTIPFFVDFLASFCRTIGLEKFVLVGHSMGGQIALHYIHRYPYAEGKIVLLAPDGLSGEEGIWLPLAGLGPIVDLGLMLNNRLFIEIALRANVLFDPAYASSEFLDSVAESQLSPGGPRATASITREAIGHDPVDGILPSIRQEALIVWGENDKVLKPEWGSRFLALLPRASLHLLPRCGHMVSIEKAVETADLIAEFINR